MFRTFSIAVVVGFALFITACTSAPPLKPKKTRPPQSIVETAPSLPREAPQTIVKPTANQKNTSDFTLDEETYKKNKEDIARFITKLNKLIEAKDYDTWLTFLSKDYYQYYSDPKVLLEQSESPLLKKYKITLRSLKDYFNYVVVGSRKNVHLDEIKALDASHIKAYMYVNGTPVIIYELAKINNKWEITHFKN